MSERRILITGNVGREPVRATMERLREVVARHGEAVVSDLECDAVLPGEAPVDLALVVGGDGSILKASRCLAPAGVPTMGINMGRLGFLAGFREEDLADCLATVLSGGGRRVERTMLSVEVSKPDGQRPAALGLNDVVVSHGATHRMVGCTVAVDHQVVATYRGDGVLVATPTGSTAYNLAAGGPIIDGQLPAVVITPICAHMLTNRPIVISAETPITLRPTEDQRECLCIVDGQIRIPLATDDVVHVTRSPHRFVLVENDRLSPFEVLSQKLHWGHGPRYSR